MENKSEETEYKVYPSLERAEENLKYRQKLFGEIPNSKSKKDNQPKRTRKKTTQTKKPAESKKTVEEASQQKTNASKNPLSPKEQEEIRKLIISARNEEKIDENHSGHSPVYARKKLIEKFMVFYRRGIKLNEKQINYVKNFFYWHPETIEPKYIKFIIPATVETMGYKAAVATANELANVLEDTKYEQPLKDYSKYLVKKAKTVKILEMKKAGMDHSQIGEKLGLSSAEVSILAENNEKFSFMDEDGR